MSRLRGKAKTKEEFIISFFLNNFPGSYIESEGKTQKIIRALNKRYPKRLKAIERSRQRETKQARLLSERQIEFPFNDGGCE